MIDALADGAREFPAFLRTPRGAVVGASVLFPVANLAVGVIPIAAFALGGGFTLLPPPLVALLGSAACLVAVLLTLAQRDRFDRLSSIARREALVRTGLLTALVSTGLLVFYVTFHTAVGQRFYLQGLGWEYAHPGRAVGDFLMAGLYAGSWALLSRALALLVLARMD